MVLAAGPELINDIKKAPDDVLSLSKPVEEVRWRVKRKAHTHIKSPVATSRIHDEIFGRK